MSISIESIPEKYQKQIEEKTGKKIKKPKKYHNNKTELDGILFDSKKEAERYAELKMLQDYGQIHDLMLQVPFELIPTQKDENNRVIERACTYVADFTYIDKNGKRIVEDVKSEATKTRLYGVKRKLMLYVHGIRITEV